MYIQRVSISYIFELFVTSIVLELIVLTPDNFVQGINLNFRQIFDTKTVKYYLAMEKLALCYMVEKYQIRFIKWASIIKMWRYRKHHIMQTTGPTNVATITQST